MFRLILKRLSRSRAPLFSALLGICCVACASAWRIGADPIQIADQEVLIYWDSENGVEHFVRRATFDSPSLPEDFGFIVPTPTQPKLSEAPDQIFNELGDTIKPEVKTVRSRRTSFMPLSLAFLEQGIGCGRVDSSGRSAGFDGIKVLDRAIVGGYEAVVLRAAEVDSLLAWLEGNGYDARPELREWLEPYIAKQWIITAFKYAVNPELSSDALSRPAVCMSFETDRPFFPYRVPADQRVRPGWGSLLRLYFAGDARVDGQFEAGEEREWSARMPFSNRVENAAEFLDGVGGMDGQDAAFPGSVWLSAFEDRTWPSGAEDLYFSASDDTAAVVPPPIIREQVTYVRFPLDVLLCVFIFGGGLLRQMLRGRTK